MSVNITIEDAKKELKAHILHIAVMRLLQAFSLGLGVFFAIYLDRGMAAFFIGTSAALIIQTVKSDPPDYAYYDPTVKAWRIATSNE